MKSTKIMTTACLLLATCLPCAAFAQDAAVVDAETPVEVAPRLDPTAPNPAPAHPELVDVLQDFGGMPGLTALMDDFMDIMVADPRTSRFFEGKDLPRIKRELAEQFCVILGGDCTYTGRDMRTAHAGMGVDRAAFNALVEDLQVAMDKHRIPFRSQNKLLAILAPMHREAVTR